MRRFSAKLCRWEEACPDLCRLDWELDLSTDPDELVLPGAAGAALPCGGDVESMALG